MSTGGSDVAPASNGTGEPAEAVDHGAGPGLLGGDGQRQVGAQREADDADPTGALRPPGRPGDGVGDGLHPGRELERVGPQLAEVPPSSSPK
jgi:hypothetical protein